jgi:BPG-independent PGAM N-terminus (iPGM_N)
MEAQPTLPIVDGSFYRNPELHGHLRHVKERGSQLHIMGLIGPGGVHAYPFQVGSPGPREQAPSLALASTSGGTFNPLPNGARRSSCSSKKASGRSPTRRIFRTSSEAGAGSGLWELTSGP